MNIQASFALRGRNPDVLTCIANLSNDEVFTPPEQQVAGEITLSGVVTTSVRFDPRVTRWSAPNRYAGS
jgi:hypothetical protein